MENKLAHSGSEKASKVILYIAVSLDGYIARVNGDVSWLDAYQNVDYGYADFVEEVGAVIMGSRTYEMIPSLGGWPYGNRKGFVVTGRKLRATDGIDIEFTSDLLPLIVRKAKRAAMGKAVYLVGGDELATSFVNQGLIDEMLLFIIPTLLGGGISLFRTVHACPTFRLVKIIPYKNCVVQLHYRK